MSLVLSKCGGALTGLLELDVEYAYDEYGQALPPEAKEWKAIINGTDWTPEYWESFVNESIIGETAESAIIQIGVDAQPYSDNCEVYFDTPSPIGQILTTTIKKIVSSDAETPEEFVSYPITEGTTTYIGIGKNRGAYLLTPPD